MLSLEIMRLGSEKLGHFPKDTQLINSHQNANTGQWRLSLVLFLIKVAPHPALACCSLNLKGIGHIVLILREKITSRKNKKPGSTHKHQHFSIEIF